MPTNINPITAPETAARQQKVDNDVSPLPLRGLNTASVEPPDVSSWVRKANARLSPPWLEQELRCGRAFDMPGATIHEAREVATLFKTFDTTVALEKKGIVISFKPRRGKMQLPKF